MNKISSSTTNSNTNNSGEIHKLLDQGVEHSKAGRFDEALECFNQVLDIKPKNADALHLSGVVAANKKRFSDAIPLIRKAINIKPFEAVFHINLGNALLENGIISEAIESYSHALRLQPGHSDILSKLSVCCDKRYKEAVNHFDVKQYHEADVACRQILDIRPDMSDVWHLWGVIANFCNEPLKGIERVQRSLVIAPDEARYHNTLGIILVGLGRLQLAANCYQRAIQLDTTLTDAQTNLGLVLCSMGQPNSVIHSMQNILDIDPKNIQALVILSEALRLIDKTEEAITAARKAIEINPQSARAYGQLGMVLRANGNTSEAIQACERSLELDPSRAGTHNVLGQLLNEQGRIDEALASYRKALDLEPNSAVIHSNLCFTLQYIEPYDPQSILEEHRAWNQHHSVPRKKRTPLFANDRDPNKKLRVGYVSADLRGHSVAFFFEPLLISHDKREFEIICYSNNHKADSTTKRLQILADEWREIYGLDDDVVESLIRSNYIDILIDLSGHSKGNRLPLFTRRPAPIQVTYLGYPFSTGIDAMDYRLTDEWADPPGQTERYNTEQLMRLHGGFLCYQPPDSYPEINSPPILKAGRATFGSFNNLSKASPKIIEIWSNILSAIPNSRLLLKSKALADRGSQKFVHEQFRHHGIDDERIEMIGWTSSRLNHLRLYNDIDIALDSYPYHGATTTCEALWMGVPVITLAGSFHISRVGVSLLHAAGLSEMIADSPKEYIRKAVELAADSDHLANLRGSLRERLQASPLTDTERITRSIEAAYRQMWQDYCSTEKSNLS